MLFRVAAGPRLGSGHLVRALRLAARLPGPTALSVRGSHASRLDVGRAVDLRVPETSATATLMRLAPSLVVVDDPGERTADPWVRAARRMRCPTVSVVDFGLGHRRADVVIDGSLARPLRSRPGPRWLRGTAFAVLDSGLVRWKVRRRVADRSPVVLVSLGGGRRATYAARVAQAIRRRLPAARVVVAGGFVRVPAGAAGAPGIEWLGPQPSLAPWLATASAAVVAGGITLYEACALGVPVLAVPVVKAQCHPVGAFRRAGAVVTAGVGARPPASAVARGVTRLLQRADVATRLAQRAASLVDGRGTERVARVLRDLARGISPDEALSRARLAQPSGPAEGGRGR